MGCASSNNPLAEGGKNLVDNVKETTDNVISMGEKAMHGAGDAVSSGVDTVKSAVESGLTSAQNSIGTVVNNIENTIGMAKSNTNEAMDTIDTNVDEFSTKMNDVMEEGESDAKTVLAFEDATNIDKGDGLKHEFGETVHQVETKVEETLHVEDMEHTSENGEEATSPTPKEEAKAEEETPPPTPWEAAADEILERSIKSSIDIMEEDPVLDSENGHESDSALTEVSKVDNFDKDCGDILLSDTLSIKSYKSEI